MKTLVVADPLEKLHPLGDSTLALVREALRRGHEVQWSAGTDLEYRDYKVRVHARKILACEKDQLPQLSERAYVPVDSCDNVLIRKDPPFDSGYVKLCWLLGLAETKVRMVNRPSVLLRCHEKMIPLEALAQGFLIPEDIIPTHIGTDEQARAFVRESSYERIVTKPFLGFGGNGVLLSDRNSFLESGGIPDSLVQPYLPEITHRGDRRVIFLDGKVLAHFVRMPKKGSFISNLAQGGTAEHHPLTPREGESLVRLGKFLKHVGITLAGADLIGHRVSEVNVTSPTGLRSLEKLEGKDYAKEIMDGVECSGGARSR